MDTVLLPHAHPCTDEVTSLPLKMLPVSPTNPNKAVHLDKHLESLADVWLNIDSAPSCQIDLFALSLLLLERGTNDFYICGGKELAICPVRLNRQSK